MRRLLPCLVLLAGCAAQSTSAPSKPSVIELTTAQLAHRYDDDPIKAAEELEGKRVRLTGDAVAAPPGARGWHFALEVGKHSVRWPTSQETVPLLTVSCALVSRRVKLPDRARLTVEGTYHSQGQKAYLSDAILVAP